MNKFNRTVSNWDGWSKVYQSIPAFGGLAKEILLREKLPAEPLRHLTPGTNAVFKTGRYADRDGQVNYDTAMAKNVYTPCSLAYTPGNIADQTGEAKLVLM